jgi:dTDP-4-amino-4,6-dideoxygalactose transaminase
VDAPVLMNDPAAEFRLLRDELLPVAERVLASGRYVLGDEVERFEEAFAARVGVRHAIGVASGTAALTLALRASGLGPGDEVLTVPNTDSPTASAITATGATIGFVDVDERTFCMDARGLAAGVSSRTAAVLPVHLFGHAADLDPILRIARDCGLLTIEDAALAVGGTYDGRWVGGWGDIGCFSLAPSKILGAYGDAGIVVTSDSEVARRIRVLRNYGHAEDMVLDETNLRGFPQWRVLEEGMNERLDALQAALLAAKLPTLETRISARREHARRYGELLADSAAETAFEAPRVRHVYFAYTVLVEERERLRDHLASRGIASRLYYNPPLHLQPAFERLGLGKGSFPVAEATAGRMLALPVHPYLSEAEVDRVAAAIVEGVGPTDA